MDWISAIVERVRGMECPCCGAPLASCGIRRISAERGAAIVRLACSVCGENSVAIVKRDSPELVDPITPDDVLDAHEFLERWRGPIGSLFGEERTPA